MTTYVFATENSTKPLMVYGIIIKPGRGHGFQWKAGERQWVPMGGLVCGATVGDTLCMANILPDGTCPKGHNP